MATYVHMALDAGARIVGGCCGTSPEHLAAMRVAIDQYVPGEKPTAERIEATLGPLTQGARAQLSGHLDRASGAAAGATLRRGTGRRGTRPES